MKRTILVLSLSIKTIFGATAQEDLIEQLFKAAEKKGQLTAQLTTLQIPSNNAAQEAIQDTQQKLQETDQELLKLETQFQKALPLTPVSK